MSDLRDLLERIVPALQHAGVPFMVAGSFASTAHGLPRATQDLDIVIDPSGKTLNALLDLLPPDLYYVDVDVAHEALRSQGMFNVIDHASGWKIDFILRKDRPFSEQEFERRRSMSLLGVDVFMASAEDTIIAKLEWSKSSGGSERQRRDVAGMVAIVGGDLDYGYIERWLNDLDLEDEWERAKRTPIS
jgi:hypothetical protein